MDVWHDQRACFDQWHVIGSDRFPFRTETGTNQRTVLRLPYSGCWWGLSQIPFAGWCHNLPAAVRAGQSLELSLLCSAKRSKSGARPPGSSPSQPGMILDTYFSVAQRESREEGRVMRTRTRLEPNTMQGSVLPSQSPFIGMVECFVTE